MEEPAPCLVHPRAGGRRRRHHAAHFIRSTGLSSGQAKVGVRYLHPPSRQFGRPWKLLNELGLCCLQGHTDALLPYCLDPFYLRLEAATSLAVSLDPVHNKFSAVTKPHGPLRNAATK